MYLPRKFDKKFPIMIQYTLITMKIDLQT